MGKSHRFFPALACLLLWTPAPAQFDDGGITGPDGLPPPRPPEEAPKDAGKIQPLLPESDEPWGLEDQLLEKLRTKARDYQRFATRFVCDERALRAEYDKSGEISSERSSHYAYALTIGRDGEALREVRQTFAKDGGVKDRVEDDERFPPAYAWVFMFSAFNQGYFDFRYAGRRFEGFDVVDEIHFRGSLAFTSGKDIRQWEGIVLVDAFNHTPLEIIAEPRGQSDRISQMYRNWASSFNIMGMRTKPKPLGYKAQVRFGLNRSDKKLNFPTELRYDTYRAVSPRELVPVQASTRSYERYLFEDTRSEEEIGTPRDESPPPTDESR